VTAEVLRESSQDLSRLEKDLIDAATIKDFDISVDMTKFFLDKATALEEIVRSAFNSTEDRALNIATTAKEFLLKAGEHNVKLFLGKVEAVKIKLEGARAQIEAIAASNDANVRVFLGLLEGKNLNNKSIALENTSKVDVAKTVAEIYGIEMNGSVAKNDTLLKKAALQLDKAKTDLLATIDIEKLKASVYGNKTTLAAEMNNSIGKILAQTVASALGAINMSMGYGYTSGEHLNESWSHGDSISEAHGFTEK
jgi:hypothetical protein